MLMALQQGVGQNADGVAAGRWPQCGWRCSSGLATMLMASQQGVGSNADGIAAGCWQ